MCVNLEELQIPGKVFESLFNAVYVGKAQNLRQRFSQHASGSQPGVIKARETFRYVSFFFTETPEARLPAMEQTLINALGPSANQRNASRAATGEPLEARLRDGVPLTRRES